jgi:hypothetical protein
MLICPTQACQNATIAKWSVFMGLLFLLFLWLGVGYFHARQRIRKGLRPLWYHRVSSDRPCNLPRLSSPRQNPDADFWQWLAPKRYRQENNPAYYNQQGPPPSSYYGMQNYPEPPPMYNQSGMPPAYMPPPGSTKAAPQQGGVPPPVPPPNGQAPPQLPPITQ